MHNSTHVMLAHVIDSLTRFIDLDIGLLEIRDFFLILDGIGSLAGGYRFRARGKRGIFVCGSKSWLVLFLFFFFFPRAVVVLVLVFWFFGFLGLVFVRGDLGLA